MEHFFFNHILLLHIHINVHTIALINIIQFESKIKFVRFDENKTQLKTIRMQTKEPYLNLKRNLQ